MRSALAAGPSRLRCRQLSTSATLDAGFGLVPRVGPHPRGNLEDRPIIYKDNDPRERYLEKPVDEYKRIRSPDDPEVPEEFKYRPPPRPPSDIAHPEFPRGRIIDFKDKKAAYPPALAIQNQRKVAYARERGYDPSRLNRVPMTKLTPRPDVPVRLEKTAPKSRVEFTVGSGMATKEKQAYYEDVNEQEQEGLDWSAELDTETDVLAPGRVVETRRSGRQNVGMILANLVMGGKVRYLVLRAHGDIWPISANDIQFVMPATLINKQLVDSCWTPDIVSMWARGEQESSVEGLGEMLEARRKVALILRKIVRETERMSTRMISQSIAKGGVEGVWERFSSEDPDVRSSVSSVEAATYLLEQEGVDLPEIRPHTLPAFAAHNLLMLHPHLFVADAGAMSESCRFLLRSRSERKRLDTVIRLIHSTADEDKAIVQAFIEKATKAMEQSKKAKEASTSFEWKDLPHQLTDWTEQERDFIWALLMSLYETRSTQEQIMPPILTTLLKSVEAYTEKTLDRETVAEFAGDIGIMPPWETLRRPEIAEDQSRRSSLLPITRRAEGELLKGHEMDSIREDYTSHKVYVVDDINSKELDDGVSLERISGSDDVWIHAHIADPTRFLPPDHPMAFRAASRGTAGYFPEGSVPLLEDPEVFRDVSLRSEQPDEVRSVMTFSTRVSTNGDIQDYRVRLGTIKDPRLVTYEAVDEAMNLPKTSSLLKPFGSPSTGVEGGTRPSLPPNEAEAEDLRLLRSTALAFRRKRLERAGLEAYLPQPQLHIQNTPPRAWSNLFDPFQIPRKSSFWVGSPIYDYGVDPLGKATHFPARQFVAELMLMAGRAAACFCADHGIPAPYRSVARPSVVELPGQETTSLETLLAQRDPETLTLDPFILAKASITFPASTLSLTPKPHWFLGFDDNAGYLRTTSPLRRFDDLMVHWQIKATLASQNGLDKSVAPRLSADEVLETMKIADKATRDNRNAGRFASEWWQAQIIRDRMANPRPDGYTYDEAQFVDLNQPMEGIVALQTIYTSDGSKVNTPLYIPSLGVTARLTGSEKEAIGEKVQVRVTGVHQWPKPLVHVEEA